MAPHIPSEASPLSSPLLFSTAPPTTSRSFFLDSMIVTRRLAAASSLNGQLGHVLVLESHHLRVRAGAGHVFVSPLDRVTTASHHRHLCLSVYLGEGPERVCCGVRISSSLLDRATNHRFKSMIVAMASRHLAAEKLAMLMVSCRKLILLPFVLS
ncbi:hypothetical protein ONZ45_g16769 [Pleurotus djamor]|nr:hypothetical protein ONZ45_g16769 [Pleurotus djamor]